MNAGMLQSVEVDVENIIIYNIIHNIFIFKLICLSDTLCNHCNKILHGHIWCICVLLLSFRARFVFWYFSSANPSFRTWVGKFLTLFISNYRFPLSPMKKKIHPNDLWKWRATTACRYVFVYVCVCASVCKCAYICVHVCVRISKMGKLNCP